jgi:hypothetical protein
MALPNQTADLCTASQPEPSKPDEPLLKVMDACLANARGASGTMDCFRLRSLSFGGRVAEPVIGRAHSRDPLARNDELPFSDATN